MHCCRNTLDTVMQVAFILSDLTSLRVCVCSLLVLARHTTTNNESQDHEAALALVSVAKEGSTQQTECVDTKDDNDMQRAKDLLDLHYNVKMKHELGKDGDLKQASQSVDRVRKELEARKRRAEDGF